VQTIPRSPSSLWTSGGSGVRDGDACRSRSGSLGETTSSPASRRGRSVPAWRERALADPRHGRPPRSRRAGGLRVERGTFGSGDEAPRPRPRTRAPARKANGRAMALPPYEWWARSRSRGPAARRGHRAGRRTPLDSAPTRTRRPSFVRSKGPTPRTGSLRAPLVHRLLRAGTIARRPDLRQFFLKQYVG